jgi:signal peptidase I
MMAASVRGAPSEEQVSPRTQQGPLRTGVRFSRLLDRGARFLWHAAVPVLSASLLMRYLVPTPSEAHGTWAERLSRVGAEHELVLWILSCVLFGALCRHFSFVLPAPSEHRARSSSHGAPVLGLLVLIVAAGGGAMLLRRSLGTYRVLSASMLPTLEPLDILAGSPFAPSERPRPGDGALTTASGVTPARGDIIVLRKPADVEGPDHLVKRVIGLPGDRISMNGVHPVINGWQVPACDAGIYAYPLQDGGGVVGRLFVEFLEERAHLVVYAPTGSYDRRTFDVRPGEVFVLGDNRNNSSDSRAWNGGKGAGLPLASIEALVNRRLLGVHRSERFDLRHPLSSLELSVRLDGVDAGALRDGVARCLQKPPLETTPPKAAP